FCAALPLPPGPTLFPYTTLFRSPHFFGNDDGLMRDSVLFASDGEAVPDTLDIWAQSCVCQLVETSGCSVVLAAALALLVDEGDGEDAPLVFGEAAARSTGYSFLDFPGGVASFRQCLWEWDWAFVRRPLDLVFGVGHDGGSPQSRLTLLRSQVS